MKESVVWGSNSCSALFTRRRSWPCCGMTRQCIECRAQVSCWAFEAERNADEIIHSDGAERRSRDRQADVEDRTVARRGIEQNFAAMRFDRPLRDRQA